MAATEEQAAAELAVLLGPSTGPAARAAAAEAALALSGSAEGQRLLASRPALLEALLALAAGPDAEPARAARLCLLNVSAEAAAHGALLSALPSLLPLLPDGPVYGLLANLSRESGAARAVLQALGSRWDAVLQELAQARPPPELGPLLCNLSQIPEGRRCLLDRSRCAVQRLFPFTQYRDSTEHRRGIVGALRNCCFEHEHHEWLLSEAVDILPFLLLPLAGPEDLPDEDMERLPPDLQYLPHDKQREEEADIRRMLLEAIMLLAATGPGRHRIRSMGTYVVLRELHGWEQHPGVRAACERLLQVLIGDEPPPGMENLLEVTIPEDVEQQLQHLEREEEEQRRQEPQSPNPKGPCR